MKANDNPMKANDSWLSNDILDILGIPDAYIEHVIDMICEDSVAGSARTVNDIYLKTNDGIVGSLEFSEDLYGKKKAETSRFALHMSFYFKVGEKQYRSAPHLILEGRGSESWNEQGFQKVIRKELAPMRRIIKRYIRKSRAQKPNSSNLGKLAIAGIAGFIIGKSK